MAQNLQETFVIHISNYQITIVTLVEINLHYFLPLFPDHVNSETKKKKKIQFLCIKIRRNPIIHHMINRVVSTPLGFLGFLGSLDFSG